VQGRVVYLIRPGQHDNLGHPNAVVLQLSKDQFLCVAGFTPGQYKYTEAEEAEFKIGIWGDEFAVEIDHARHLIHSATTPLDLHICGYVFQTAEVMTTSQLQSGRDWGLLPASEIKKIAEGLLAREAKQQYLPRIAVRLLKQFLS
jgi:hypothetical protein